MIPTQIRTINFFAPQGSYELSSDCCWFSEEKPDDWQQ